MPTTLSLDTESAGMLAIPFKCWVLTLLGIAAASMPIYYIYHCQCVLSKFLVMVCGLNVQVSWHF